MRIVSGREKTLGTLQMISDPILVQILLYPFLRISTEKYRFVSLYHI